MPYGYSEHISDIGIAATGQTLESAFEEGASAMLNVMFDLSTIDEKTSVKISAEARDIEMLFVEVLNEVLSVQGRDDIALKRLECAEIKKTNAGFGFTGAAFGEAFSRDKHSVKTEVKGATYSGLNYGKTPDGGHVLRCVLDV